MMRLLLNSIICVAINLLPVVTYAQENNPTQSVIYDAITVMNATHQLNALLIPVASAKESDNKFNILNPLTGEMMSANSNATPDSLKQIDSTTINIIKAALIRVAELPMDAGESLIKAEYKDNPFLTPAYLADILDLAFLKKKSAKIETIGSLLASDVSGALTAQNLLNNLANGVADFLIKRANEEISITVFERLQQLLLHYPEFAVLFPKTVDLIKPVSPYEYTKLLKALQDAIHEDLKQLVSRIAQLYDLPRYKSLNKRVPALTLIFSASTIIANLQSNMGPAQAFYDLSERDFLNEKENNYSSFIKVVCILSNSFRDKKLGDPETPVTQYGYINPKIITLAAGSDPEKYADLARLYLGFIWQQTHKIQFASGSVIENFGTFLKQWENHHVEALQKITAILSFVTAAEQRLADVKKQETAMQQITGGDNKKIERYTLCAELIDRVMSFAILFEGNAHPAFTTRVLQIQTYWPSFTDDAISMVRNFDAQQYNLGIHDLSELLKVVSEYLDRIASDKLAKENFIAESNTALNREETELKQRVDKLKTELATLPPDNSGIIQDNKIALKQELTTSMEDLNKDIENLKWQKANAAKIIFNLSKIIEYVNLLASVSTAENSQAVESLLEAEALPAGSSRIKKVTAFNISVNAYVGGFGRVNNEGSGFTNNYGFTAPIGFAFSKGFEKAGSASIFLGIFDIGGIIRYKLNNEGKYEQDISFAGIVSPSVQAVYGFPWYLPLSIGFGCQWISPTTTESNAIHLKPFFNAFIGVDIPLFNLTAVKKNSTPH